MISNSMLPPQFFRIPEIDITAFLNEKLKQILSGDITVTIGSKTILADVSPSGRADLVLIKSQIDSGASTVTWYQSTGSVVLTSSEFEIVLGSVTSYVSSSMAVWQAALKDIQDGKIKNPADVESLSWPSRSY